MIDEAKWTLDEGAAYRLVGGEYFVVTADRAFHHIHVPSAVTLFEALVSGPQSGDALTRQLCGRFDVDEAAAGRDISMFLKMLVERGLASRVDHHALPATTIHADDG